MNNSKACNWCKQVQPLSNFSFENKAKNLLKNYCNSCNQQRLKIYYQKNQSKLRKDKRNYYRENKEELLNKAFIYRQKPEVKKANKAWMSEYLKKNPDAYKPAAKKRKAILRGAKSRFISKKEFLKLQNSCCFYCHDTKNIQLDHVVPISRGGNHSIGNLVSACQRCNLSKNKWFITEWKKLLESRAESFLKI